jgi:hypothetical protein
MCPRRLAAGEPPSRPGLTRKDTDMADGSMNLTVQRGDNSVWDSPGLAGVLSDYDQERWMAAAWGSALTVLGARRGGFGGGLLATLGVTSAIRAAMGRRDLHVARRWVDSALLERGWRAKDIVTESSADSFPASDAPSWTADSGATINR